jgi:hypothetical protein
MSAPSADLVARAESCLKQGQFNRAGKWFEEAAAAEKKPAPKAALLQRAGSAFLEDRSLKDAGRCYWQLNTLLGNRDRAQNLMLYWHALILEIAGCRYECGFEWKGEPDHHEDHLSYQRDIEQHQQEAIRVLTTVLHIEGVDRKAILEEATADCRRRQQDGWGAAECEEIIGQAVRG